MTLAQIKNKIQANPIKSALFTSLFFHLLAICFSQGFHRPDEHLGMMRMSYFKLGLVDYKDLSWEIPAMIRSWLQPAFYACVIKVAKFLSLTNPFTQMTLLRFINASLALFALSQLVKEIPRFFDDKKIALYAQISLYLFWFLPFFHVRSTTENFGALFFNLALALFLRSTPENEIKKTTLHFVKEKNLTLPLLRTFFLGLLLGLSFIFRYQMSVMIASLFIWAFVQTSWSLKNLITIILGIALIILLSTLIDYWGYQQWTFTPWNYLYQNLFKGVASGFGVSPWWWYLKKSMVEAIPLFGLPILISAFYFLFYKRAHLLTWLLWPYFIVHSAIGHKELRFIFCLLYFALLTLFLSYQDIKRPLPYLRALLKLAIATNLIFLFIATLRPAFAPISFYRHLYDKKESIHKIYTLGVYRDQLKIYLKNPIELEVVSSRDQIDGLISQNTVTWFLSDKFSDFLEFEEKKECQIDFLMYPKWIKKFNWGHWLSRSKVWGLIRCQKK